MDGVGRRHEECQKRTVAIGVSLVRVVVEGAITEDLVVDICGRVKLSLKQVVV